MISNLSIGLRDICITAGEQQELAKYMNAQLSQTAFVFLMIGFVVGLSAGAVYIYFNNRYGN